MLPPASPAEPSPAVPPLLDEECPVREPDSERLPDEEPLPNPDEHRAPALRCFH